MTRGAYMDQESDAQLHRHEWRAALQVGFAFENPCCCRRDQFVFANAPANGVENTLGVGDIAWAFCLGRVGKMVFRVLLMSASK